MKSTITLILSSFLWIFIAVVSLRENVAPLNKSGVEGAISVEETEFLDVKYFQIKDNLPAIELVSKQLKIREENFLTFDNPEGFLLKKNRKIKYSASSGSMDQREKLLKLEGGVSLDEEKSSYSSDKIIFEGKKDRLIASGNVKARVIDEKTGDKIRIRSHKLVSRLKQKVLKLSGGVKGSVQRKRRYESGMNFEAQEVIVKYLESLMEMSKSVKIQRNNYYLSAGNAEVSLENYNKKLKYYTLYDDVKLEEKLQLENGSTQVRRAYAERLIGYQKTGKIVLSGAPRVEQGRDVIKGYKITLRENTELVEVDDSKSSFDLERKR